MSRVRILNLPNDTSEKELREHFTKHHVPPTAPALEITDVMIKRVKPQDEAGTSSLLRGRGGVGGGRGGGRGGSHPSSPSASAPLGKIRMAFVGFKSSAAGHFVVSYYNNSYFRSSKIRVELAKGLNEVGVTLNMKKKLEKQKEEAEAEAAAAAAEAGKKKTKGRQPRGQNAIDEDPLGSSGTRKRGPEADELGGGGAEEGETLSPFESRKKARKELFMDERDHATGGPSWAAEVLVPHANNTGRGERGTGTMGDEAAHAAAEGEEDEEERERRALEKQKALGEVSDVDFLSGLGGGGGARQSKEESADVDDNATHGHSRGEDGGNEHTKKEGEEEEEAEEETVHGGMDQGKADDAGEEVARVSRRVRLGNIPYTANEDHVKQFAASLVGPVEEVHIPLTKDTRQSKGAAFVKFVQADDAVRALALCRGAILMGRLLRVSAAEEDPHSKRALERDATQATATGLVGDGSSGGLAGSSQFKIRKEMERRGEAGGGGSTSAAAAGSGPSHVSWNTMYMNSSAAVENVAQRLGVKSDDLVSVQARGAAVRAAIAEAYLTSEIQQVLSDEGVAFDVIESGQQNLLKPRSNTTILVKNLQLAGPDEATELSKLFVRFGTLETSAFPSSGTFALFRFVHPQDARTAFTRLSYKLFKNAPLFLEWAPVGAIVEDEGEKKEMNPDNQRAAEAGGAAVAASSGEAAGEREEEEESRDGGRGGPASAVTYTAFLTNIPFSASEDDLHAFLLDSCPRLAKSPDTLLKRLVFQQQQGRAYVTLADAGTFAYCLSRLNGRSFEGRTLSCVASKQTEADTAAAAAHQRGRAVVAVVGSGGTSSSRPPNNDDDEDVQLRKTAGVAPASAGGEGLAGTAKHKVPPGGDPHKIIVKNVPFEATEADIRELFSAFSEVKSVRLPKKTNNFTKHRENNHRGFAFVEFLSATEAARAMDVLKATHLYGRHLVLQYAKLDG